MSMKNLAMPVILAVVVGAGAVMVDRYYIRSTGQIISNKTCDLKTAMRELWAHHVIWTREYIVSTLSGSEDNKDVTERLLRNQVDIGDAIVPFYGAAAGTQLSALLKDHILIAAEVVAAAKANDQDKLKEADARWHKNASEMSVFLNKANVHWAIDELNKMFDDHLRLTAGEAVARIKKDWKADIKAFDDIFNQIMGMADMLTFGIVKQFPDKF